MTSSTHWPGRAATRARTRRRRPPRKQPSPAEVAQGGTAPPGGSAATPQRILRAERKPRPPKPLPTLTREKREGKAYLNTLGELEAFFKAREPKPQPPE